ncbi:hypothetical protein R3P38DRAFT_2920084 [Favolaschia claudopus]|uniref:Uncharacterized protein n=1 Tax=Favolaschia claudopus TaxID=2862362 RepID=A0AAW0C252_9AGAR
MSEPVAKTPYTAKFYEAPSSSESTNPSSSHTPYLQNLFHTHVALSQMKEVPADPPDQSHIQRVDSLRQQVLDAYKAANGNPASGKWGVLTTLLRTSTSKGKYRYINTTVDAEPPKPPPGGWPVIDTEEEWLAWERKRKQEKPLEDKKQQEEEFLKQKVQNWQRDVDDSMPDASPIDDVPDSDASPPAKPKKKNVSASGGSKPTAQNAAAGPSRLSNSRARTVGQVEEHFFPPSFPSNLDTSTPPVRKKPFPVEIVPSSSPLGSAGLKNSTAAREMSPVEEVPSSSPMSPKLSHAYGKSRLSESPLKRARSSSPTPITAPKRIRAAPPPGSRHTPAVPPPLKPASKAPITPPRNALPKLEDLIAASAQKQKSKAKAKKAKEKLSEKSSSSKSPDVARSTSRLSEEQRQREVEIGDTIINWDATLDKMAANHAASGASSPAKSLSSIAESNSLESPHGSGSGELDLPKFSDGVPFDPIGASTQPMGQLGGESLGTTERGARGFGQSGSMGFPMHFESQMDVESNMQGVDDLLDADVGGYTGPWMGAGSDDEDQQWVGRSGMVDSSSP